MIKTFAFIDNNNFLSEISHQIVRQAVADERLSIPFFCFGLFYFLIAFFTGYFGYKCRIGWFFLIFICAIAGGFFSISEGFRYKNEAVEAIATPELYVFKKMSKIERNND